MPMSKNLVQNWMPPAHVVQMPSHANGQMIGAMRRSDFGVWNKRSWSKVGATAADCSSVPGCRLVPLHSYQTGEIYGHIWYCMGSDFRQTKGISSSILWILLNHIKPFHVWSAWSTYGLDPSSVGEIKKRHAGVVLCRSWIMPGHLLFRSKEVFLGE